MFKISIVVLACLSYVLGLFSYVYFLETLFGQSLKSDLGFVVFATVLGFLIIACPLYIAIVYLVDKYFKTFKLILYPLACVAIFFVPTLLVLLIWGGTSPFSPEAQLFYFFYLFSGLTFGLGYRFIQKMNWGSFYKSKK